MKSRGEQEIIHGRILAEKDPEMVWGWKTPAGKIRAVRRADLISKAAKLGPTKRVLEIGCGTGLFTRMFALSGAEITAIDISDELLKVAKEKKESADKTVYFQMDFNDFDATSEFDAVIGSSILHHIDVRQSLGKILSLLRPGGMLCMAEPNFLNPQVFLERTFRKLKYFNYVSPDETAFVRWQLKILFEDLGFENVRIDPVDWLHPVTPPRFIGIAQRLGRILERTPLLREFSGSLFISAQRPQKFIPE